MDSSFFFYYILQVTVQVPPSNPRKKPQFFHFLLDS